MLRSKCAGFVLLTVTLLLAGCNNSVSDGPAVGGDFAGRLAAAKAINDTSSRDNALRKLAADAGAHGEGDFAKQAVNAISNSSTKDDAASKAALRLAKAGKGDAATVVAKLINNSSTRDEVLGKLAKGDY
jgi:hypothetical protein